MRPLDKKLKIHVRQSFNFELMQHIYLKNIIAILGSITSEYKIIGFIIIIR